MDIRDSEPDRSPLEPPKAPDGAPERPLHRPRRQAGEPVTSDYQPSDAFAGGTLHQVSVNVSGEPYLDLERHALKAQ